MICKHHPAAPLLNFYLTKGCPADCGDLWSKKTWKQPSNMAPTTLHALMTLDKLCEKKSLEMLVKDLHKKSDKKQFAKALIIILPMACIPYKIKAY